MKVLLVLVMMMAGSCMLSEMVDAQVDLNKCKADALSVLQACSSNDETQCCSAFSGFVNTDEDCLCAAVEAGTLDSDKIYQAASLCHFTVPSSLSSCLAANAGARAKASWIGVLLLSIPSCLLLVV